MPVIIQSGWTKGRGRYAQPQRHHGASQFHGSTRVARTASRIAGYRVRVRLQAGDSQCVRTLSGHPARNWENNLPAIQSAAFLTQGSVIADVSSLVGVFAVALSAIGVRPRLFNSFGPYQVARHLSSLVKCFQQPTSGFTKCFRVLSCVSLHVDEHEAGGVQVAGHFTQGHG